MEEKKLRIIFFLCLILVTFLIIITSIDFEKINEENVNKNISESYVFTAIDYNNLSDEEKERLMIKYGNLVNFTEKGVEVYVEEARGSDLDRIITSSWPDVEIGKLVPVAEYGTLDRIEYNKNWLDIYIKNADKSDAKDYLKKLKEYNFRNVEDKNDGEFTYSYKAYDENGNNVTVKFLKQSNTLEINVKMVK